MGSTGPVESPSCRRGVNSSVHGYATDGRTGRRKPADQFDPSRGDILTFDTKPEKAPSKTDRGLPA
jgi:hypothetical protein